MDMIDLIREYRINNSITNKRDKFHTWERETSGTTKRLDSFWGKSETLGEILDTWMEQHKWIRSDHKLHLIDWDSGTTIEKSQTKEERIKLMNNKRRGETLNKKDWQEYKDKVENRIKENKKIKTTIEKNTLSENEIEEIITEIETTLNNNLIEMVNKKVKQEEQKEEIEIEHEEKLETTNTTTKRNKINQTINNKMDKKESPLKALNLNAFKTDQIKKREPTKLPKGIDGPTAKLIKIKHKVLNYRNTLQRIILGKQTWKKGELIKAEQMGQLSPKLEIKDYTSKDDIGKAREEARKISNMLTKTIYKNKNTYQRREFQQWISEMEEEGWRGTHKFYTKILKKTLTHHSIRKIPKKYLKEKQIDTNPDNIKEMIKEYWEKLYTSNEEIKDNHTTNDSKKWFTNNEWKQHREKIEKENMDSLTAEIEYQELEKTIKKLKNNKTGGPDELINEQIKYGPTNLWNIINKIFNNIITMEKYHQNGKRCISSPYTKKKIQMILSTTEVYHYHQHYTKY
jgi:hypothetical protein